MTEENKEEIIGGLFPIEDTPLGHACQEFVGITTEIADCKVKQEELEKKVLEEMKKENRTNLTITVGNDNYDFDIKLSEEKLRCVKKTRKPQPKAVVIDEQ